MAWVEIDSDTAQEIYDSEHPDLTEKERAHIKSYDCFKKELCKSINDKEYNGYFNDISKALDFNLQEAIDTPGWTAIKIRRRTKKMLKELLPAFKESISTIKNADDLIAFFIINFYYPDYNKNPGKLRIEFMLTHIDKTVSFNLALKTYSELKDELASLYVSKTNSIILNHIKAENNMSNVDEAVLYLLILAFDPEYHEHLKKHMGAPPVPLKTPDEYRESILQSKDHDKDTIQFSRVVKYAILEKLKKK